MKIVWDDYALFAALADAGSLAGAATATGASQATLSRRMRAFEARLGKRLFEHGNQGYRLTGDGLALAEKVRRMALVAGEIDAWQEAAKGPVSVKISAGSWTALDLAEHIPLFWTPNQVWRPEIVQCETLMDIARREVDVGLRDARPTQPWLAGRAVGEVNFAVYGAGPETEGFIGRGGDGTGTASSRWVEANHGAAITVRANTPFLAASMARAGIGRVVLPTFVGDRMARLVRLSDPIEALTSPQWLVSHQDLRHTPPVRAALDAIAVYISRDRTAPR
ncbi:MAG: LysR family transcriptional regulator [Pseudomonadota bacterium]